MNGNDDENAYQPDDDVWEDPSEGEAIEIPFEQLSADALLGVIDDFVLREGTNYGHTTEATLEQKREQVLKQLRTGQAVVLFDTGTSTCTIVVAKPSPE